MELSMRTLFKAVLFGSLFAALLAASAEARPVYNKTFKSGRATVYSKGGDYDTVIGPKARVRPGGRVSINPQPLPPRTR
jgi:hypothetical protein